jgi:hypothetical protein
MKSLIAVAAQRSEALCEDEVSDHDDVLGDCNTDNDNNSKGDAQQKVTPTSVSRTAADANARPL